MSHYMNKHRVMPMEPEGKPLLVVPLAIFIIGAPQKLIQPSQLVIYCWTSSKRNSNCTAILIKLARSYTAQQQRNG